MDDDQDLSPAHYRRLPHETERQRLERLYKFVEDAAKGESGGFWALERERLAKELQELPEESTV